MNAKIIFGADYAAFQKTEHVKRKERIDSVQLSDFWLLLFVSVVILLFVFRFYS